MGAWERRVDGRRVDVLERKVMYLGKVKIGGNNEETRKIEKEKQRGKRGNVKLMSTIWKQRKTRRTTDTCILRRSTRITQHGQHEAEH